MAVYTYVAKDEKGGMFTGTYTDVDNASGRSANLTRWGMRLLVKARRGKQDVKRRRIGGRVKQSDVAAFAYKFAGMYTAGLPILEECLETLEQQADNPAFKNILTDVRENVGYRLEFEGRVRQTQRGVFGFLYWNGRGWRSRRQTGRNP